MSESPRVQTRARQGGARVTTPGTAKGTAPRAAAAIASGAARPAASALIHGKA